MNLGAIREWVSVDGVARIPTSLYSELVGWGARAILPVALRSRVYHGFATAVGADLTDVELPLSEYDSFGEFFARGLRSGARVFPHNESLWVYPCDGRAVDSGYLNHNPLYAKGHGFSLPALVASQELASVLAGGEFMTVYLSPKDYHRVHVPTSCRLLRYHYIPGCLYPVSPLCADRIPDIFAKNERLVLEFAHNDGVFALVMVGAAGVGSLRLTRPPFESRQLRKARRRQSVELPTPIEFVRGDEIGAFELGSTVILCSSVKGVALANAPLGAVRYGDCIGVAAKATRDHGGLL